MESYWNSPRPGRQRSSSRYALQRTVPNSGAFSRDAREAVRVSRRSGIRRTFAERAAVFARYGALAGGRSRIAGRGRLGLAGSYVRGFAPPRRLHRSRQCDDLSLPRLFREFLQHRLRLCGPALYRRTQLASAALLEAADHADSALSLRVAPGDRAGVVRMLREQATRLRLNGMVDAIEEALQSLPQELLRSDAPLLGLLARTCDLRSAWVESDTLYRAAIELAETAHQRAKLAMSYASSLHTRLRFEDAFGVLGDLDAQGVEDLSTRARLLSRLAVYRAMRRASPSTGGYVSDAASCSDAPLGGSKGEAPPAARRSSDTPPVPPGGSSQDASCAPRSAESKEPGPVVTQQHTGNSEHITIANQAHAPRVSASFKGHSEQVTITGNDSVEHITIPIDGNAAGAHFTSSFKGNAEHITVEGKDSEAVSVSVNVDVE